MCVHMPITQVTSHVSCSHLPQIVVLLFPSLYSTGQSIVCSVFISSPGCPEANIKAAVMQFVPVGSICGCTVLLYFSRYCTVRFSKVFFLYFLMYCLCEKYYKPIIVQYYIADCVSWVPRELTVHGNTIFFFFYRARLRCQRPKVQKIL